MLANPICQKEAVRFLAYHFSASYSFDVDFATVFGLLHFVPVDDEEVPLPGTTSLLVVADEDA